MPDRGQELSAATCLNGYPAYVRTDEERKRWRLATVLAQALFEDVGGPSVWLAIRAICASDVPTD